MLIVDDTVPVLGPMRELIEAELGWEVVTASRPDELGDLLDNHELSMWRSSTLGT